MGHACVIAFPRAAAAGGPPPAVFTMWVNPRNINIPGHVKRKLMPHQSFIYKAFTSPEHRGRKLYEAGMRFVLADMARQGKRELLGYAHINKTISRKGLAATQFRSIGTFTTIGAGRAAVTILSSAFRRSLPLGIASSGKSAAALCESPPRPQ